jgi:hypothetical protein
VKFSTAVAYRSATVVGAGALAAVAFAQGTEGWDVAGAVLLGIAITDVILLLVVTWFHWRHRGDPAG